MKDYRLTPKAKGDLFNIWSHIAPDNLDAADRLEAEIFNAFQRVADKPDLGHFRRDLTQKPVRFFLVRGSYLIVYDPASEPLQVLRVLHGARAMSHGIWKSNEGNLFRGGYGDTRWQRPTRKRQPNNLF
jgi:plasmid stabilization system protein ParE